jgi:hypothetical protein
MHKLAFPQSPYTPQKCTAPVYDVIPESSLIRPTQSPAENNPALPHRIPDNLRRAPGIERL